MRVRPIIIPGLLAALACAALAGPAVASHEIVVYVSSHFSMRGATIAVGDRVRFTVRDRKNHQLWKKSGSSAGDIPPNVLEGQGASVTLDVNEAGSYAYVDRLNPSQPEFHLLVRR